MATGARSAHLTAMVPKTLASLLGVDLSTAQVRTQDPDAHADCIITAGGQAFVVEVKATADAASVDWAARQVRDAATGVGPSAIPVLVVPYMGEVGRARCAEHGVGWFDLSGNAHIVAPGLRVIVEGKPNRFRQVGRPSNVFAPKSSRVVRWLLMHPDQDMTQREIARAVGLDEGFVSRLVRRLERSHHLIRDEVGAVRPRDPSLLLQAWRDTYRFEQHTVLRGHVVARSGDALLRFVTDVLQATATPFGATGLAGAWAQTHFGGFRIATLYVETPPGRELLQRLGFREEERGANLWLVVPKDEGVFDGAGVYDGIRCVHPVQVYVDLKAHPERAAEAAERVRTQVLSGGQR